MSLPMIRAIVCIPMFAQAVGIVLLAVVPVVLAVVLVVIALAVPVAMLPAKKNTR